MTMHLIVPPSVLVVVDWHLEVFLFIINEKNVEVDDYLKSSTPTFILEPFLFMGKQSYGMFAKDIFEDNDQWKHYVPNYKNNLIEADIIECLELFQTDLRENFGMMHWRKDKEKS